MGVINKTTEQINSLLDKVEGMPEEGVVGKTPVLETGTTTTLPAGSNATSQVVANGTDASGNPKYKLNFGIPKGQDGTSSGGGGVADSVQWNNVLNKPTWVNSSTKPAYTATEVGALPATTTIPSKTSQLTNDSNFTTTSSFKTVNGQSIVGSGNIEISGTGSGIADAPSDGKTYGRKNGAWASIENVGGSVDITDILNRLVELMEVQGTCTDEDYNALKGYADNGVVTFINMGDGALHIDIQNINNIILLRYNIFNGMQDTIQQITIGSNKLVSNSYNSFLGASNMGDGVLGSYNKAASYSAITPGDSISTAIGKLEVGLSSGGGSSDDVYYLDAKVLNLKNTATVDEVKTALGGDDGVNALKEAMKANKKIYVKENLSFEQCCANVDYLFAFNTSWIIKIHDPGFANAPSVTMLINQNNEISIIYDKGFELDSTFYNLTDNSTSEEVSTAIGGEDGMKELIKAIKDGNNIYIKETINQRTQLLPNMLDIGDDGNMSLKLIGFGYTLWGSLGGFLNIDYNKSSNTFRASFSSISG